MKEKFLKKLSLCLLITLSVFLSWMYAPFAAAAPFLDDEEIRLSLEASPDLPYPGETVRVRAKITPPFDQNKYGIRWRWEGATNNLRTEASDVLIYEVRDAPATLSATLWARSDGNDVATGTLTVEPRKYTLSIRSLTPEQIIRLWDDEKKSLTETRGRTIQTRYTLEAVLEPLPEGARFVWTLGEGTLLASEDMGRCLVYRETPGSAAVSLHVFDKNNLDLGEAKIAFDVDVSSEMMERSEYLSAGWARWENALALREKGEAEAAFVQSRQAAESLVGGGVKMDSLQRELEQFRLLRDNSLRALETAASAASLQRDGQLEEALALYRQARASYAHESIERNIAELESSLQQKRERKENAAALAGEAADLAAGDDLTGAVDRYRESLALLPDPEVRTALANVEGRQQAIRRKMDLAQTTREIGLTLEAQDHLDEALMKMTEARDIWPLPDIFSDAERIQTKITDRQNRKNEADQLAREAAQLERRGLEGHGGQGDPGLLAQASEIYRRSMEVWSDPSPERAIERVASHRARIDEAIARAALLVREGEILEREGHLSEALNRYHQAQDARRSDETAGRIEKVIQRRENRQKLLEEAQKYYAQAEGLEKQEKLDEALESALAGQNLLASADIVGEDRIAGDMGVVVSRLQNEVGVRDEKIERARKLAEQAKAEPHPEKALDLYLESENIWHNDEVVQAIRVFRSVIEENRSVEERAAELYKEAVILERESAFGAAEEKLRSSLALRENSETQSLLDRVQKRIEEKNWADSMLLQPLELRLVPLIPHVGEYTTIRINEGVWTNDARLDYQWRTEGNAAAGAPDGGGQSYTLYPADGQPVTVFLSVSQKGTERPLMSRSLSFIAEPRSVRIILNEENKTAKLWNFARKRLEETREYVTSADVELHAEISPLPEGEVSYSWSADAETALNVSQDNRAAVRRLTPGTSRVEVTAKDSRGIVLGTGSASFLISVDKNDVDQSLKRSQARGAWTEAQELWDGGARLEAIDRAMEASLLDPGDADITHGLFRMKDDLGKMEQAARLLSEGAFLLTDGKTAEADGKLGEAEKLWPDGKSKELRYALQEASEKARKNGLLALNLRKEGEAFLERGLKAEALLRFQDSLLLADNDVVSQDILRLKGEIEAENARRAEAGGLREKGYAMADVRHYTEALDYFSQSMKILPSPYLAAYIETLREKAGREKIYREEAARLRKEGDALMEDKETSEALAKYRESLKLWSDPRVAEIVREEEERIARETAAQLRREAEALVKRRRPEEALAKYRESLTYAHNNAAAEYVRKADEAEANALIKDGDALAGQEKPREALASYRLARELTPDNRALLEKIRELEMALTPAEDSLSSNASFPAEPQEGGAEALSGNKIDARDLLSADVLYREGTALYRQKKYREALEKYKESYRLSQSRQILDFVNQLETALDNVEKAGKLVQEANALYRAQKYGEALAKYKESLELTPNPEVKAFVEKLQGQQ